MVDFSKLTEWIKLKPRYLFALFFFAGILLISSETSLATLGLDELVESYRGWIGVVFLASGVLLLTQVLVYIFEPVKGYFDALRHKMVYSRYLKRLSGPEKEILRRYIDEDTQSQRLAMMDGVATGLESKRILTRASSLGTGDAYFAYNIQPWAFEYLQKHPELLEYRSKQV